MKKRILCMLLIIVMVISLLPTTAMATTPDLVINTVEDLENFRNSVNNGTNYSGKLIMLGANLDLSGKNWTPIGSGSKSFQGTFDGNGYIISNLTITNGTGSDGLFGVLYFAHVKNLGLENVSIQSYGNDVGGLAGKATGGSISQCYVTGTVKGSGGVAGILGSTQSSYNPTTISNCYARVDLTGTGGTKDTAGISGWNYSTGVTITNCYSACTGEKRPIAGWSDGSAVQNSRFQNTFFDKSLSPNFSDGVGRVDLGRTSDQLRKQSTFTGWDFVNVWNIDPTGVINSGYPYLRMKSVPTSAASYTVVVTFKIEGGKWADGTTADKTVNVKLSAGKGTLNESSVPTGMTADAGYGNGSWDAIPATTANGITEAVTYTYKFYSTDYTVTVTTDGNGQVTASHSSAAENTEVSLSATPNNGYQFKEWEVVSGSVTITDNKFVMPASAVEIKAIFEPVSHSCAYTYSASGNVITESCDCGHSETATLTAPSGNLVYDGTGKTAAVSCSDGWQGGNLAISYTPGNINAGEVIASVAKGEATISIKFTIALADQVAPTVGKTDETISGKADGIITGITANMEYRKEGENAYTAVNSSAIENLAAGKYYVRYAGNSNHNPSADTEVIIAEGRKLLVTYKVDGVTFDTVEVSYGDNADAPQLPGKEGYTGTWNGDGKNIVADTTINAVYTPNQYTITFDTDGGSEIAAITQDYDTAVTAPADPTKTGYTFAGWDAEIPATMPAENVTIKAKWTVNQYTITFLDEDGTVLQSSEVAYGEKPVYTGKTPTKTATAQYTYTFNGWDKEVSAVTGEVTYTATYSSTVNKYTVTYKADGNVVKTVEVEYGKDATAPAIPAKEGYTQTAPAWDKDGKNIIADTEINAVYTINKYIVTYKADGQVVKTVEVEHGKDATAPAIPAKEGYTQTAPVWDKIGKNITADTEIDAVYTVNKYTVIYKADDKVVKTVQVEHGKDAAAPEIPAKEGFNETAPKWDGDGKSITADTEINAVYTKNQPGEFTDVTPNTNVGGGKISEKIADLKEKVPFTQEEEKQIEHGVDVEIWLEIKDISASVSAEDKAKVDEKLGDADVALYLDIAMIKQVGENEASRLTQLGDKVQITFKLPDAYINADKNVTRTYSIIHVHDGEAEIITPVFDEAAKTLTFLTDRFSTYAVVYTDVVSTPPTEETTPPTEKPTPPAETPATGDSFQPVFWIACMILCIIGIADLLLDSKRRHAR